MESLPLNCRHIVQIVGRACHPPPNSHRILQGLGAAVKIDVFSPTNSKIFKQNVNAAVLNFPSNITSINNYYYIPYLHNMMKINLRMGIFLSLFCVGNFFHFLFNKNKNYFEWTGYFYQEKLRFLAVISYWSMCSSLVRVLDRIQV